MANNKIKTGYTIKCSNDICDNMIYIKKGTYDNSDYKLFSCSNDCKNSHNVVKKRLDKFEEIHGIRNKGWTEESQNKIKQTNLKKYGCENPFQNEDIKNKIKQTNIKKYGVDHVMKHVDFQKKSTETRIRKYGSDMLMGCVPRDKYEEACLERYGVKHFFQSTQGKSDLDSLIDTYGKERGNILYNDLSKKKAITLENMIKKYGEDDGVERYNKWKSEVVNTLDNMIKRHGETDGLIRYKKYVSLITKSMSNRESKGVSNISLELFDSIVKELKISAIYGNDEFFILNENKKDDRTLFLYDFKYKNKIIEFNGDFWHGNPNIYSSDSVLDFYGNKTIVQDLWTRDLIKIEQAKQKGFDVLVVWEQDYRLDSDNQLNKCISFLLS